MIISSLSLSLSLLLMLRLLCFPMLVVFVAAVKLAHNVGKVVCLGGGCVLCVCVCVFWCFGGGGGGRGSGSA